MQDTLKQPHTDALLTKTESLSGSEAVMKAFVNEGVEIIFGYPGGAIMPIYDALYDYREVLQHILVRHEQGGAIADLLAELPVRLTRLARGITTGSILEYTNKEILADALAGRQSF